MNKKIIWSIIALLLIVVAAVAYWQWPQRRKSSSQGNEQQVIHAGRLAGVVMSINGNVINARGNMLDDQGNPVSADIQDFQITITPQTQASKTVVQAPTAQERAKGYLASQLKRETSQVTAEQAQTDLSASPNLSITAYSDTDITSASAFNASKIEYTITQYPD